MKIQQKKKQQHREKREASAFLAGLLVLSLTLTGCSFDPTNINSIWTVFDEIHDRIVLEKTQEEAGVPVVVDSISGDKYAYSCLNEEEKIVYDQMLDCILDMESDLPVSTTDADTLSKIYTCVMADYGGLFWVSGYDYRTYSNNGEAVEITISPKYTMTQEQRDAYQIQVDEAVTRFLGGVSDADDDYTKSKYIFEHLIESVDYDTNAAENQNILSVFLGGATVCQGYADAAQYLFTQLNIPCMVVTGTADGQPHAWNLVYLDQAWYLMDVTWGNSKYSMPDDTSVTKFVNYSYLNMTTEELAVTHSNEMPIEIPECTAEADNYFRREGLYFDTWLPSQIGARLHEASLSDTGVVSLKFSNSELYSQAKDYFISQSRAVDYVSGLNSFYYLENDENRVLTFQF